MRHRRDLLLVSGGLGKYGIGKNSADDATASIRLKADYGKAHARLGLSLFFLGHYEEAIEAYRTALKYEPDNKASLSYLHKAEAKLEETRGG